MARTTTLTVLAAAALLAAALGVYAAAFREPATVAPPPAPLAAPRAAPFTVPVAVDETARFELAEVSGVVEVRRAGVWLLVRRGETLAPGEAIRTGDAGRAVLRTAEGDELSLRPRVELEVDTLDRTVTELTLTRGKVRAATTPGRERFAIRAGDAQAVGGRGGRFTVYADARGAVTVASAQGDVKVVAAGREVTVGSKQQTTVPPGAAPGDPVPIPDEVLLSVRWPEGEVHARSTVLEGRTSPGGEVRVNGTEVPVDDDGGFSTRVPLREGKNRVTVTAEDMLEQQRSADRTVHADTDGPPLEADPSKLYDPEKKTP